MLLLTLLFACGGDEEAVSAPEAVPTYYQEARSVIDRRPCPREGSGVVGVAPLSAIVRSR